MRFTNDSSMEVDQCGIDSTMAIDIMHEAKSKIVRQNPNAIYMTSRNESLLEKQINQNKLCTKYPVFKDVKGQWSYDYKAEEKKRFKA